MAPGRRSHEDEPVRRGLDRQDPARVQYDVGRYGGQEARVSEQSIYTWRKRHGELEVNNIRRLRSLDEENARLKTLAERDLKIEVMKEIM